MMKIKLVVGLGNPGKKYSETRHNLGEMIIRHLPFFDELDWQKKFKGFYSQWSFNGDRVYFLFPQTFMNLSGESVGVFANFHGIAVEEILVVHDELDLSYGQVAFKNGGGCAGHNGLKSIADHLGSKEFMRFRLGISRPPRIDFDVSSWVLSKFSEDERKQLSLYLKNAAAALKFCLQEGLARASSLYNKKNLAEAESPS